MNVKMLKNIIKIVIIIALITCFISAEKLMAADSLILGTTTSVNDSGLLDELISNFTIQTGIKVKVIAVGTGQALEMGKRGEVDILLVHAKDSEEKFVKEGYGISRIYFMYNDFVIVGPKSDTLNLRSSKNSAHAFKKIYDNKKILFFSRGDNSGTEKKERSIWSKAGIKPYNEKWYKQTGSGMGQTLLVASEKNGCTLSDRGTYLSLKDKLHLDILFEKDPILKNEYSLIAVNNVKFPKVNYDGAQKFIKYMTSKAVLTKIGEYGVKKNGYQLFIPDFRQR